MSNTYILVSIAIIAGVTALLRFIPFIIFGKKRETPKIISYLGNVLPQAMMGMLVIYCLRKTEFTAVSGFLPQTISTVAVVVSYCIKRNTLLSIICGTVIYMLLVQYVF